MTFSLGPRSVANLAGLHPGLLGIVHGAIVSTSVDFGVTGKAVRTAAEQHKLFLQGVTQKDGYKNKSNHQTHVDGFGYAVDLTPFINGQFDVNNEAAQYPIAVAMSLASKQLAIPITWGGNWYEQLTGDTVAAMRDNVRRYQLKHPGPDFIDLPHFQLR